MSWLARAAWLLPCAGIGALGLLPASVGVGARAALVAAALGAGLLASGVVAVRDRRRAAAGLGVFGVALAVVAIGAVAGWRARALRPAQERAAVAAATSEAPGWYGAVTHRGARLFALELDGAHGLGAALTQNFAVPLRIFAVGVDNRRGSADLVVDLGHVELLHRDGHASAAPERGVILAGARRSREHFLSRHGAPYHVAAGSNLGQGLLFVDGALLTDDLAALILTLDGAPLRVDGRVLTVDEKRAAQRAIPHP